MQSQLLQQSCAENLPFLLNTGSPCLPITPFHVSLSFLIYDGFSERVWHNFECDYSVLSSIASPENNAKMREWLFDKYAASTFNTCPHRPLHFMAGPPIEIHVDPLVKPMACHTPSPIPLHWQQKVHDDFIRDEATGILKKVPHGKPTVWCHRTVITRKHNGSHRRTADLSPLYKFCNRETHAFLAPFHLARRVTKNTWKTVTDTWNGYHSVRIRKMAIHQSTSRFSFFRRWLQIVSSALF